MTKPSEHSDGSETIRPASVLVVQAVGLPFLEEELADRIQAMPHVETVVNGGLIRAFSYPEVKPNLVAIIGAVPGYSTQDYKLKSGRLLKAGDHKKAVISSSVADGLQKSIGDRIKYYGPVLEVVGIAEPQDRTGRVSSKCRFRTCRILSIVRER